MLRILEPELSNELKSIATEHVANTKNIDANTITVENAWLQEFFNTKVDVYMIEAIIDRGLATEQKIQIPVRVDTKTVLSEADITLLAEEDDAQAPDEPVARIMTATDTAVAETTPITEDIATAQNNNTAFFYAGAMLMIAILISCYIAVRIKKQTK